MKSPCLPGWLIRGLIFISIVMALRPVASQTYTALPLSSSGLYTLFPYYWTGIVTAPDRSSGLIDFGSGAVVKSPRVVFSCAHVVFDTDAVDPWLNSVRWYRAWASGNQPSSSSGQFMRSYYYYVGYAAAALSKQNSSTSFSMDFLVHYAYENTANGGYAGYWEDGVSQLKSTSTKLITGYPTGNYASGDSRKYLMHGAGPFTRAFTVISGDYLGIDEVSTGSGNSGGPVWVSNGSQYLFAGVLVSGLTRSTGASADTAGVYGVDTSSTALIDAAVIASGGTVTAPTIIAQPTSRRVIVGESANFSVNAFGATAYRWLFNNSTVSGATNATFAISNVTPSHAGTYQVVVSNAGGETRSSVVTLSVDVLPTIVTQPVSQTVAAGTSVTLSVAAQNSTGATYQWRKDGVAIVGATAATLTIAGVTTANAGSYTVTVTNSVGPVTSSAASLAVTISNPGRLINLSILTPLASGETMTLGTALGGAGTSGAKPLLVRAVGPSLTQLGVPGALPDPKLDLLSGQTVVSANDNWGGTATLANAFTQVGAFAFASNASRDAAVFHPGLAVGNYTVQVNGVASSAGTVIAELYDSTPGGSYTLTTPRLINVSVLKRINTGETLTAGFVVGGATQKTVLMRAIGPSLAQFFVNGVMADPKLDMFRGQTVINSNDNWGGGGSLVAAFAQVGAFALPAASRDAALLVTLTPGNYTAQVTGVGGSVGTVLVEVYEVP